MPIADSNAERRNLTVLSLSIIIFFLADGRLSGSTVSLPMVNVEFNNPQVLVFVIWAMLAWFHFRYWQEVRSDGRSKIRTSLSQFYHHPSLVRYIEKKEGRKHERPDGLRIQSLTVAGSGWTVWLRRYSGGYLDESGTVQGMEAGGAMGVQVDSRRGFTTKLIVVLRALRTEGCIWAYWTPFALAGLAWGLGVFKFFDWV